MKKKRSVQLLPGKKIVAVGLTGEEVAFLHGIYDGKLEFRLRIEGGDLEIKPKRGSKIDVRAVALDINEEFKIPCVAATHLFKGCFISHPCEDEIEEVLFRRPVSLSWPNA